MAVHAISRQTGLGTAWQADPGMTGKCKTGREHRAVKARVSWAGPTRPGIPGLAGQGSARPWYRPGVSWHIKSGWAVQGRTVRVRQLSAKTGLERRAGKGRPSWARQMWPGIPGLAGQRQAWV